MATGISNLTIEELTDIVTKSIDLKLQEGLRRNQDSNQNHSPNRHRNHDTSNHIALRHSPRYQHYQNTSPHHNNNASYNNNYHHNNNAPYSNNYHNNNNSYHYNNNNPRYNDYQSKYSPRGNQQYHSGQSRSPNNPNTPTKTYQPRLRRFEEIKPLKIMITYVETACTFWGQVLTPDLLDATRQLETDLQDMCPGLPPVDHINKGGVYGTLWCDRWYRCITCQIPDEEGNTEVLFVDYGNKEKKNIADLVSLRSPKLLDVPFFAYPFRFPKLEAVPEKMTEAIGKFDTDSILTGFVSQTPCPSDYTDIFVNRPLESADHPNCTTYNELMVELGFAKKSEESTAVRRPQPGYYIQALQQRIRLLSSWCKEKDVEIGRLSGGQPADLKSPFHDIRYPVEEALPVEEAQPRSTSEVRGDNTPKRSVSPSNVSLEVEQRDKLDTDKQLEGLNGEALNGSILNEEVVNEGGVQEKMIVNAVVNEDVVNEDVASEECLSFSIQSIEEEIQGYILSLVDKIQRYNTTAAQIAASTDTTAIRTVLEQVASGAVGREVEEQRSVVEKELEKLEESSTEIQLCSEAPSLQSAVGRRDEHLLALSEAVARYQEHAEKAQIQDKLQVVSEIAASYQPPSTCSPLPSQPLEELLDSVTEMGGSFTDTVSTLQAGCAEQLALLNEQLLHCTRLLNHNFTRCELKVNGSEELEKLVEKLDDKETSNREAISFLGETLKRVSALSEELLSTSLHHSQLLLPLSISVKRAVHEKAVQRRTELEKHVTCLEEYAEKARSAQNALQNKPDLSKLNEIKKQLKAAKREVKLSQITEEEEEEEGDCSGMRNSMIKLHRLYQSEQTEFSSLLSLAQTTHPELLIQHPQLHAMSQGDDLLKTSWELHEFVLPDTAASLNSQGLNVYSGFYSDLDPVYFVECALHTVEGSLEEHARAIIRQTLPDCFAIILNKRNLRVYGATTLPPV